MWLTSLLLSMKCIAVFAWTTNELFIYDLVEEVGESFYDFYGISNVKFCYFLCNLHIQIAVDITYFISSIWPDQCDM